MEKLPPREALLSPPKFIEKRGEKKNHKRKKGDSMEKKKHLEEV